MQLGILDWDNSGFGTSSRREAQDFTRKNPERNRREGIMNDVASFHVQEILFVQIRIEPKKPERN